MTTPQTPDDTAGERLAWALTAAMARGDEEGYRLLEQDADEQTVRAAIAENPGTDLDRDRDRILLAVARSASLKALEAARDQS